MAYIIGLVPMYNSVVRHGDLIFTDLFSSLLESHGICNLLYGRLPNEFHVTPSHFQIGRGESCPLCLSIHIG